MQTSPIATLILALGLCQAQLLQAQTPAPGATKEHQATSPKEFAKKVTKKIKMQMSLKPNELGQASMASGSSESATPNAVTALPSTGIESASEASSANVGVAKQCLEDLAKFPGEHDAEIMKAACARVQIISQCKSVENHPIYHYDKMGTKAEKRILVFSMIHGDEVPAGSVGRYWMERLENIDPRNSWRIVPVLNPDGFKRRTRTNANNVDINRNFPTQKWDDQAQLYWKKYAHASPRKFPGNDAASEPETLCAMEQIKDFAPHFIVSIHTPLKVLDFDGPKVSPPKFDYLPWKSLGHYPGSLGRYMWFERKVPVLTTELKEDLPATTGPLASLQDIVGTLVKLDLEKASK